VNSPLGKYSQAVAAGIAVAIIGAYIISIMFSRMLALEISQVENLKVLALIAVGAVFGSAATINGVKAPLDSAHTRIDTIETATGIPTHSTYVTQPAKDANHTHDDARG
jgi:hypothetical protein